MRGLAGRIREHENMRRHRSSESYSVTVGIPISPYGLDALHDGVTMADNALSCTVKTEVHGLHTRLTGHQEEAREKATAENHNEERRSA